MPVHNSLSRSELQDQMDHSVCQSVCEHVIVLQYTYLRQLRHTHAAFLRLRVSSDMNTLSTAACTPLSISSSITSALQSKDYDSLTLSDSGFDCS